MALTSKQKAYIKNAPKFDEHFSESFKNPEYVQAWLEDTLTTFLNTGDVNEFVDDYKTAKIDKLGRRSRYQG